MHLAETSILTNYDFLYDFFLLPLDDLTIKYKIPSLQTQLIRFGKMTRSNYKITYCCGHFCTLSSAKEWFSTNFYCMFCSATSIYAINIYEWKRYHFLNIHSTFFSWNLGILESWKIGILESWKIGRLEDWKIGRLEFGIWTYQK